MSYRFTLEEEELLLTTRGIVKTYIGGNWDRTTLVFNRLSPFIGDRSQASLKTKIKFMRSQGRAMNVLRVTSPALINKVHRTTRKIIKEEMARLAKSPASRRHWTLVQRYLAGMKERKDMDEKQAEEERQAEESRQAQEERIIVMRQRAAIQERQATDQQQEEDPEDSETPPQPSPHTHIPGSDIEDFDLSISRIYARLDETQWRLGNCIRRWERWHTCW